MAEQDHSGGFWHSTLTNVVASVASAALLGLGALIWSLVTKDRITWTSLPTFGGVSFPDRWWLLVLPMLIAIYQGLSLVLRDWRRRPNNYVMGLRLAINRAAVVAALVAAAGLLPVTARSPGWVADFHEPANFARVYLTSWLVGALVGVVTAVHRILARDG